MKEYHYSNKYGQFTIKKIENEYYFLFNHNNLDPKDSMIDSHNNKQLKLSNFIYRGFKNMIIEESNEKKQIEVVKLNIKDLTIEIEDIWSFFTMVIKRKELEYKESISKLTLFDIFMDIEEIFSMKSNKSPELTIGLFGELFLIFIAKLKLNINLLNMENYRTENGQFSTFDILYKDKFIEVKTTTLDDKLFIIKNIQHKKQRNNDALHAFVFLQKTNSNDGLTLESLINKFNNNMKKTIEKCFEIEIALIKKTIYFNKMKFLLDKSEISFVLTDSLPFISKKDIPLSVKNLRFHLDINELKNVDFHNIDILKQKD